MELEFIPEKRFMQRALELAEEALLDGEVPVGAVVEQAGIIVGMGRNRRERGKNALYHAEIEAIDNACKSLDRWRLNGCRLYVTLEPCVMCAGAIINARMATVVFGADDDLAGGLGGGIDVLHMPMPSGKPPGRYRNFMQAECRLLLARFFEQLRKERI